MTRRAGALRTLLALALVAPALAGCLSDGPAPARGVEATFVLELPVHVVAVGFEGFDAAALASHLGPPAPVFKVQRAFVTASIERERLQYDVRYQLHEAPEAFARELFSFAASVGVSDPPDAFLADYDRAGEQRVCPAGPVEVPAVPVLPPSALPPPACGDITRIDALALEDWIETNRAAHGLAFDGPGPTIFLLDSYTNAYLPRDSYHQYTIGAGDKWSGARGVATSTDLRAWGGQYDFVFLDVGAAPNSWDYRPWLRFTGDWDEILADVPDGPIWDYAGDIDTFYANLGRNVVDAVSMVWARDPRYPIKYADRYVLPTYVIVDRASVMNPASPLRGLHAEDLEARTNEDGITRALRDLAPWADVEMPFTYIVLPDDDPALAAAVQDAKERYDRDDVDMGILKKYFRDHWDQYVPSEQGPVVYPTFAFWFGEPSTTVHAFSAADEWGDSWAAFFNIADGLAPCLRVPAPVCTFAESRGDPEIFWRYWNVNFVHELGHSFGLMHPHDSGTILEHGAPSYQFNWVWDSTIGPMTYRHALLEFSPSDKQLLQRNHAVGFALDVLALGDDAPREARDAAERALALVRAGEDRAALEAGREAKRAAGQALEPQALGLVAGEPLTASIEFPAGTDPVGRPPRGLPGPASPLDEAGVSWKQVAVDVPRDATAVKVEFRERDAPSHALWVAFLEIYDAAGEWVTGAYDNAYGAVVLLDMTRCVAGCTIWMQSESGAMTTYDVTVTPLYGEA
ncbi:MAG: hypothetical protein ACT4PT_05045 [Methanobacteriota archaeon]